MGWFCSAGIGMDRFNFYTERNFGATGTLLVWPIWISLADPADPLLNPVSLVLVQIVIYLYSGLTGNLCKDPNNQIRFVAGSIELSSLWILPGICMCYVCVNEHLCYCKQCICTPIIFKHPLLILGEHYQCYSMVVM